MLGDEPKTGRTELVHGPLLRLVVLRFVWEGSVAAAAGDEQYLCESGGHFDFSPIRLTNSLVGSNGCRVDGLVF